MKLTAEQIITYLHLPQIGRMGMLKILKYAHSIDGDLLSISDMLEFYNECAKYKIIQKKKETSYDKALFEQATSYSKHIIQKSTELGIKPVGYDDTLFPEKLKIIVDDKKKDASPVILFVKGNINHLNDKGVAIVGTRDASKGGILAGKHVASMFAQQNYNIISGLAIGCDTSAHQGALSVNGTTTAFLASGLDQDIYPFENKNLAEEILEKGGMLISEYPVGECLSANKFIERDRLMCGLADATIVIQTGVKGGTMYAVNATILNGKPLFAIDYQSAEERQYEKAQGNFKLLKEGLAHPFNSTNFDKILDQIEYFKKQRIKQQTISTPTELTLF